MQQQQPERNWLRIIEFFGLGVFAGLLLLISVARLTWHTKFYPGITIAGVEVAGLTREQARTKLTKVFDEYQTNLTFNGALWNSPKGAIVAE